MRNDGRPWRNGSEPFKPRPRLVLWGPDGELPVDVREFTEGTVAYYGTGMAVVVLRDLPITVRLPLDTRSSPFRWLVSSGRRSELIVALRKITAADPGASPPGPGAADAAAFPELWQHLTATTYPDGSARQTSSVIVVADAQGWRGCVSDKDNGRTLWRSSETVEGLLVALEDALAADDPASWRQAGGGFKNRRKRS